MLTRSQAAVLVIIYLNNVIAEGSTTRVELTKSYNTHVAPSNLI
jgi:hypothetical protein